jgi:2-dehydro-3-deoxyglucarate aldolase/4-hydroxy-2-oxoheptanedioate aldolase
MDVNTFGARFRARKKMLGGWFMSGSPTVLEMMGCAGYDFVVIDMEHGPEPIHALRGLLQAIDSAGCMNVVRMASQDRNAVKHALDLGALSLYFPFVQTADEARALSNACYYPPVGERGYAKMHRGSRYTTIADYPARVNDELCVIAQLETPLGIQNMEAIANTKGITGLFVGPGDLSVTMGHGGDVAHPAVRAQMEKVGRFSAENNMGLGTVMPTPELVKWAFDVGFTAVSLGSDMGTLMGGMKAGIARVKELTA